MQKIIILTAAVAAGGLVHAVEAETIYGLTTQNSLTIFDSSDPETAVDGGFIGGLQSGEFVTAIDYRVGNDTLYAITSQSNLYSIDQDDFTASFVGNFAPPAIPGTNFAMDFNPAFGGPAEEPGRYFRVISNLDDNRVIDSETGQYLLPVEKTDVFYAAGDANEGVNPTIIGNAYDNNNLGATSTTQYGIDRRTGDLVTIANNAGTLNTIGSLNLPQFTVEGGLDIAPLTNNAFAALQINDSSALYSIDLSTGAATALGNIEGDIIRDLAVIPAVIPEPTSLGLLGMAGFGLMLRRRR